KHYGHTIETMIERARMINDPEKKQSMTLSIANFMKMAYLTWNKDAVEDDFIISDLKELSNGELQLSPDVSLTKLDFKTPPPGSRSKGGSAPQNGSGKSNKKQPQKKKKKY